jgi:predicted RND superfamily exporter protein
MIGFGCLLIAKHRGIQSLGFVMVMGLGVTLLACYLVLPAILKLRVQATAQALADLRDDSSTGTSVRRKARLLKAWRKSA